MSKRKKAQQKSTANLPSFELTITEVSRGGAGVGRDAGGRTIFVPFTAAGDVVRVRLIKSKQSYAEAELLELVKASPQRQEPPCPVFTQCGGCQWQHLPYELQWKIKREGLIESLRRAGISTTIKWDEYPAERIWGYRNRIQMRKKGSQLGFYSGQSHQLVAVQQCAIACSEINEVIAEINSEIHIDEDKKTKNSKKDLKLELYLSLQGKVERILDSQHASHGFRQVNDEQNENLRTWVKQSVKDIDGILDLYGGSGNLSLGVASTVSEIHCVDLHIAKHNTSYPDNIEFHQSAVRPWLEARYEKFKYARKTSVKPTAWLALLDPPRSGLDKDGDIIIQLLAKLNVVSVILVGCKADPWSRDIKKFISQGWSLDKAAILDFFPQTSHVESAALLTRTLT